MCSDSKRLRVKTRGVESLIQPSTIRQSLRSWLDVMSWLRLSTRGPNMAVNVFGRNCVSRLAMYGVAVLIGLTINYAARSQPPVDTLLDIVRVKRVKFIENEPEGLQFHLGWLASAAFDCASATSTHQVSFTMEVWKEGKLIERDGPKGIWVADADSKPHDAQASVTVAEYPGNTLMLRKLNVSKGGGMSTRGMLEVKKPVTQALDRGYTTTAVTGEIVLAPGQEKTMWAMKWSKDHDDWSMKHEAGGTVLVTDEDKSYFLILLKAKLHPWYQN